MDQFARDASYSFAGGCQTGPTTAARLQVHGRELVLRKQPPGKLLPSAHNVAREHRVISALQRTAVPVPQTVSLCTDTAVLGGQFYVMQFVDGVVHTDPALPALSAAQRRDAHRAMAGAHETTVVTAGRLAAAGRCAALAA